MPSENYINENDLSESEMDEAVEHDSFVRGGEVFLAWRRDAAGVLFFRRVGVAGSEPDPKPPSLYGEPVEILAPEIPSEILGVDDEDDLIGEFDEDDDFDDDSPTRALPCREVNGEIFFRLVNGREVSGGVMRGIDHAAGVVRVEAPHAVPEVLANEATDDEGDVNG